MYGRVVINFVFGLAPNSSILCIGSSLISCFSFVAIRASGVLFVVLLECILCYQFHCFLFEGFFSFIILSRNFLSVIAVTYFEINSSSSDMVLKLHSFPISISLLQNSSRVSLSDCLAQKNCLGCCRFYVLVGNVLYMTGLSLSFLSNPVPFYIRLGLFGRGLPVALPK